MNESNSSFALYDIGLIKQDLLNHFHIRQGEKLENPEFGTIIWDILYDPLTDEVEQALKNNIEEIIDADPRIRATAIVITPFDILESMLSLYFLDLETSSKSFAFSNAIATC